MMQNHILRRPEAAGFLILGATLGAVLANMAHAGLLAAWAGGTAGAVLVPVAVGLPWARLIRRVIGGRVSSTV